MRLLKYLLLLSSFAFAASADSFSDGVALYEDGKYTKALEQFEKVVTENVTAAVRHNLALTYFQLGKPEQAAWQIERAVRLSPFNGEYQYKLGALRSQLGFFESKPKWHELAAQTLSFNSWIVVAVASFWISIAACIIPRVGDIKINLGLKSVRGLGIVAFLISISGIVLQAQARPTGIVTASEATALHAAPASAAPQIGNARPGERARAIDQHNEFVKIETEGKATGWILQNAFRKLVN